MMEEQKGSEMRSTRNSVTPKNNNNYNNFNGNTSNNNSNMNRNINIQQQESQARGTVDPKMINMSYDFIR